MGSKRDTRQLPNTLWEGPFFEQHSLGLCNRETVLALLRRNPDWRMGILPDRVGEFRRDREEVLAQRLYAVPYPPEVTVRFQFPPDFRTPPHGHLVVLQPWEYWAAPREWVRVANEVAAQFWVPSRYVRDGFVASGMNPDRVFVTPHGVDPVTMRPDGPMMDLPTDKGFRFLFVGGTIPRKGADVLLTAYLAEFGPDEDVCLVIKEFGAQSFYRGQGLGERIRAAASDPNCPSVVYVTGNLSEEQVPNLYRACDALVHPFRGEGYGLPIAEAMACGLPVIITRHGAPLDYVNDDVAYLVDATEVPGPAEGLASFDLAIPPLWAEPSVEHLRRQMREVFENRAAARAVGRRASEHMHRYHTWDAAAGAFEERLASLPRLDAKPIRRPTFIAGLALDLKLRGRVGVDLAVVERALREQPDEPALIAARAKGLLSVGNWDEAVRSLEQARVQHPDSLDVLGQLAWAYAYSQREDLAYQVAEHAMGLEGTDYRLSAALVALYGHYTNLSTCKWISAKERKAAQARAGTLEAHLVAAGWSPEAMQPLGTGLSLCMIVKNEETNLPRCLDSVRGVVDEIVVADTGSTDRTVEIAEAYGAKVVHFPWCDDFSAARNESLRHATKEWILWLDADETLEASSIPTLREGLVRPQFGGYMMQILNFMSDGEGTDVFTHRPCRLFRRLPRVRFEGRIHEQVMQSIAESGLPVANLAGARILHYGYSPTAMQERGKTDRTLSLIQAELERDPENVFHQFNLANTYYVAGRYEEAATVLAGCADRIHERQDFCATAYHLWASAMVNLNRPEEALTACQAADARGVESPAIEFSRATALYQLGRHNEALEAVERTRSMPWKDETTGDYTVTTFKLRFVEGQCRLASGDTEAAVACFEDSLRESPDYPLGHYFLALALAKLGRAREAVDHALIPVDDAKIGNSALLLASHLLSDLSEYRRAAQVAGQLSRRMPENEELWARWLHFAEKAEDWQEINAAYSARAEHGELSADMFINWGRACASLQDWDRALAHMKDAIDLEPTNANAMFNAGDLLYKLGAYNEAADAYQAALRLDPKHADGWFVLGNALFQLRVFEGAKVAFQQALQLRPGHEEAKHNLELVEEVIRATAA